MRRMGRTAGVLSFSAFLLIACASARFEKQLDPESRDFYSKVRYIITSEENRTFRSLPASERKAFIEDFWNRRDPTPGTKTNAYKDEYFRRISEANHLFKGSSTPGWLQDRGMVYITLGRPDIRETYPRGITFYGLPTEIWWYGFFTIRFVDSQWTGQYWLDPDSAAQVGSMAQAQRDWNQPNKGPGRGWSRDANALENAGPEYDVKIDKAETAGVRIRLNVPYRNIFFRARGSDLQAALEVGAKIVDTAGSEVWTFSKVYPIEIASNKRRDLLGADFTIDMDAPIGAGSYTLNLTLSNTADGTKTVVKRDFKI